MDKVIDYLWIPKSEDLHCTDVKELQYTTTLVDMNLLSYVDEHGIEKHLKCLTVVMSTGLK